MKRDKKGRYTKIEATNDGYEFNLKIPLIKTIFCFILIILIFFPWTIIGSRFDNLKKIFVFFDNIMTPREEGEPPKKGIFY